MTRSKFQAITRSSSRKTQVNSCWLPNRRMLTRSTFDWDLALHVRVTAELAHHWPEDDLSILSLEKSRPALYIPLYKGQTASRRSVENGEVRDFTTLPYSFEPRSRLFGSHLARSQAGTTSVRGCYRSRRLLLPCASRRNAPTRAG